MTRTIIVLGFCLSLGAPAFAGALQPEVLPPSHEPASGTARERLADLLASDSIDRIDVVATTFNTAMSRIYTTADLVLQSLETVFDDTATAYDVVAAVVVALDDHEVRTSAIISGEPVFMILDEEDATTLAEVIATVSRLVAAHGVTSAPRATAERIFRLLVVDTELPLAPLEQYRSQLHELMELSHDSQAELLR